MRVCELWIRPGSSGRELPMYVIGGELKRRRER